jgi:hypothetical protein
VTAVWQGHEEAFQEAMRGYQKNDNFEQACVFFERLTGLKMHVELSTIGFLTTPESANDLARLRAWYRINKHRLFWDESTQAVRIKPLVPSRL